MPSVCNWSVTIASENACFAALTRNSYVRVMLPSSAFFVPQLTLSNSLFKSPGTNT